MKLSHGFLLLYLFPAASMAGTFTVTNTGDAGAEQKQRFLLTATLQQFTSVFLKGLPWEKYFLIPKVEMTDMIGRTVRNTNYVLKDGDNEINVDASSLSEGSYVLRIVAGNEVFVKKFIRQ